jgi:hypothetical protein
MKRFYLGEEERRALLDMGGTIASARTPERAKAWRGWREEIRQKQVAKGFRVHLHSMRGRIGTGNGLERPGCTRCASQDSRANFNQKAPPDQFKKAGY